MKFESLSLKSKLIAGACIMALIVALVSFVDFFIISKVSNLYSNLLEQNIKKEQLIMEMSLLIAKMDKEVRELQVLKESSEKQKVLKQAQFNLENYKKLETSLESIESQETVDGTAFKLKKKWTDYQKHFQNIIGSYESGENQWSIGEWNAFNLAYEKSAREYNNLSHQLIAQGKKDMAASLARVEQFKMWSEFVSLSLVFLGILLPILLGVIFAKNLSSVLSNITSQLSHGVHLMRGISSEIASSSNDLSDSTSLQAANLQETMSSVNEMSAMIGRNTENTQKSQSESENSSNAAQKGQEAVQFMITSIKEIEESNHSIMSRIETSHQEMSEIVGVINEIAQKTKVINEIVFQTKLLSFNASVEAARAGEHGKGFAVVAEEVGNLAQMSGNAAKEITQLLDQSVQKVETIVQRTRDEVEKMMSEGSEKVEKGIEGGKRCSDVLDEIVSSVTLVHTMLVDIARASEEQKIGVQEIERSMEQLDEITQNNNSQANKASGTAASLKSQADEIAQAVEGLSALLNASKQTQTSTKKSILNKSKLNTSNILAFKKSFKIKKIKSEKSSSEESDLKQAVGSDLNSGFTSEVVGAPAQGKAPGGVVGTKVPSRDDSRFEDV